MARFKLIGAQIEGQDVNQSTLTADQQRTEARDQVVYETDDQVEANEILKAGGFFRNRDNFIAVTSVVDSEDVQRDQPDTPFFRPASFPQKGN
jgi:hypothetical protein